MLLPKIRNHYWSCSRLADFIRGSKKPFALTSEEWKNWRKEAQLQHPIRYWIAETLLRKIQDICYFPYDVYKSIKYYIYNRFYTKTHFLKTGFKAGYYYELDERILHGLFNELKEYVESELAWMQKISQNKIKYKFKNGRCPQAGIDYLKWASKLKQDKKLTEQALDSRKVLKLYNWWLKRPDRPDPLVASGWHDYCEKKLECSKESRIALNKLTKLEAKYDKEDEDMLIELIKIRKSLWT